jgi:hypothetical protein
MREPFIIREKFLVEVGRPWKEPWAEYFQNFYLHCQEIAIKNNWVVDTVANTELKPLGGRLIKTKTQGWYLRWDDEKSHTFFVLKWS